MTNFRDQLWQGNAFFEKAMTWNSNANSGLPSATAPNDTQILGVPHTQSFFYQIGTASTALASGIFYSASGTATSGVGTLTCTGALVTASVATFDVPRGIRITASVNLSTTTFTFIGTDGYGQTIKHSFVGPTGNTVGNVGSYTDSLVAFKTVTSASSNTATGTGTTLLEIGNNDTYGLPYFLPNVGLAMDLYINGSSATVPATFTAGFTATGVSTASTTDVRGLCAAATTALANGTRYFTVGMITPNVNQTVSTDDKVHSFGAAPFGG